jgi:protein O-GlcNAc transferase
MFDWLRGRKNRSEAAAPPGRAAEVADDVRERAREARESGNAHLAQDRFGEAARCYEQAVQLDATDAAAWVNLGFAECSLGLRAQAREHLQKAVALQPDNHDAHYLLGSTQEQLGDLQAAALSLQRTLQLQPSFELAYRDLCRVLFQAGRFDEAAATVGKGLALNPGFADLHFYQGNLRMHEQQFAQAAASFLKALSIDAAQPQVHVSLGNAYDRQGQWELAAASYERALALGMRDAPTLNLLGTVHMKLGRFQQALASYQEAIRIDPSYAEAHSNLGNALRIQGSTAAAIQACQRAVELQPTLAAAHNNLGVALSSQGRELDALQCFLHAVSLEPANAQFHGNCGGALQRSGDLGEAVKSYRRALALDPTLVDFHSNLLFALSFSPDCSPQEYLEEARRYGAAVSAIARPLPARVPQVRKAKTLRVGLVSGDLRSHPVGAFLEGPLACLDPGRIELVAYSTQPVEDDLTRRIKPLFSAWRNIWGVDDEIAARQIRDDEIDILVDLAGHSEHNRLPLFAWKPAPVQVSWLGYLASTGVQQMDYLLADRVSVTDAQLAHFTETVWRLPHGANCLKPPAPSPRLSVTSLPALRKGHVTFGSFQNIAKVNDAVLKVWGRILEALPTARLRLQVRQLGQPAARDDMRRRLMQVGIGPERANLEGALPDREEYLATHGEVDIVLDTFPYPGITTTCEALWMGVPTVTLAGETLLARQGASLMNSVGLPQWVAADPQEYIDIALAHASDLPRLAQLRAGLRQVALASPLFDARRFAIDLQSAFEAMASQC